MASQLGLDFNAQPLEQKDLRDPTPRRFGRGRFTGWERITSGTEATPEWVTSAIRQMERGNVGPFVRLAQRMEERFAAYSAALQQIKDGLGAEYRVKPAGPDQADKDAAEAVKRVVEGDAFQLSLVNIRDAIGIGYSVVEIRWADVDGMFVPVQFIRVPPDAIQYANDGYTPLIRAAPKFAVGVGAANGTIQRGPEFEELFPGRFISHVSRVRSGLPVNVGLAKSVAYLYLYATMAWQSWGSYLERYGNPWVVGTYPEGSSQEHIDELEDVLASLGNDASSVHKETLTYKVLEHTAASGNANGAAFRDLLKSLDHQAAIAVVGSDMTDTGSGSRALGEVLQERTMQRVRSFAFQESATFRQQLVAPMMALNTPAAMGRPAPYLYLDIEGNDDMKALGEGLAPLLDRGAQVEVEVVLDRAGLPIPVDMPEGLMMHPENEGDAARRATASDATATACANAILEIVEEAKNPRDKRALQRRIKKIAQEAGFTADIAA